MTQAAGIRADISYVKEVTRGTTPGTPTMKRLRAIERNINPRKNILETAEVRPDRMKADQRHGFNFVEGTVGFELAPVDFEDMLEVAMASAWAAPDTGAMTLDVGSTTTFTRSTGSFLDDGFTIGQSVTSSGFVTGGNNGTFTVSDVTDTVLTISAASLTVESGDGDERILGDNNDVVKIGTTLETFTFERRFNDILQYQTLLGCTINNMEVAFSPENPVRGSFTYLGMSNGGMSGTSLGSPTEPTNANVFDAFTGRILVDGTSVGIITNFNLTLANNRTNVPVLMSKFTPDLFEGEAIVGGGISALLEDATFMNYFDNETEVEILIEALGLDGSSRLAFRFPRSKINRGDINPPTTGPIMIESDWAGLYDTGAGTSMMLMKA